MAERPWINGPIEVLVHAVEHYYSGSEKDYRFALISCDNAVELSMKVFLQFHNPGIYKKIRKDWNNISRNFEKLLAVTWNNKKSLSDELKSSLRYYHKLRNNIYHETLAVPRKRDVFYFISYATELLETLFNEDLDKILAANLYDKFMLRFINLDFLFQRVCRKSHLRVDEMTHRAIILLAKKGVISQESADDIWEMMELKGAIKETEISQDQLYRGLITLDAIIDKLQNLPGSFG